MLTLIKLFAIIMFFAIVALVWAFLRGSAGDDDQMWPEDHCCD